MAKYGNTNYLQLTRYLWNDEYKGLSVNAKWLFICLKELEHRYCNEHNKTYFFCSDKDLCDITGMSINTVKRAKKELRYKAMGLIYMSIKAPTKEEKSGNKYHPTVYHILK